MTNLSEELKQIEKLLKEHITVAKNKEIDKPLTTLIDVINNVAKTWSGSWIGYQSKVYYRGFQVPPPRAHFSSEWGMKEVYGDGTVGDWAEYDFDSVVDIIHQMAKNPDLEPAKKYYEKGKELFEKCFHELHAIFAALTNKAKDQFISDLINELKEIKIHSRQEYVRTLMPSGIQSRDSLAMYQGIQTPPHVTVECEVYELKDPCQACSELLKIASKASIYLERTEKIIKESKPMSQNIFIGHGNSAIWKDLKDFLNDKLNLPWDEYNRVSTAGVATASRLEEMLDSCSFAFLIMTAEDETPQGKLNARLNVIHEVGLFQGRLGFKKAIILLEEGCEEFSNIVGLGQIRFPKGNVIAKSEEIRDVLKREGLIT